MSNPMLFLAPLNGSLAFNDRAGGGTLSATGAVRYAPASGALTNLMRNPSAATTATNMWIATTGGSMSRVTTSVLGPTAYRVAATSSANSGAIFWRSAAIPAVFQITNKTAHTFAADVALVSGTANWQVMFYELDAAGTVLGAALGGTSITPTAGGVRVVVSYTPTTTGVAAVCPGFRHLDASTSEIDVRAATLVEGTYASLPHFDGSTGGVWLDPITGILGTAHASPSVSQAVAWVEEGTTNLIPDPLTNNNPTGSQIRGAGTNVLNTDYGRSTAFASTGSGSWWRSGDGTNANRGIQQNTASSLGYTGSVRTFSARSKVRVTGGPYSIAVTTQIRYTDATFSSAVTSTVSVGDDWTLFELTGLASNSAKTVDYVTTYATFSGTAGVGVTLYWTDIQIEEKTYCTSLCAGSIGTGYAWSGTAHASSSTRTATALSVATTGRISNLLGSIAVRAAPDYIATGGFPSFLTAGVTGVGTDALIFYFPSTTNRATLERRHDNVTRSAVDLTPTMAADTWAMAYSYWNGTLQGVSLNNSAAVEETHTTAPTGNWGATGIGIGANSAGGVSINGLIGPVLIADRPLTAKERATLNARTSWGWSTLKGGKPGLLLPI